MFRVVFERTKLHERGFQRNPVDRGNWTGGKVGLGTLKGTKFGISAMSYPSLDIKHLTVQEAREIYLKDFWIALHCPQIPFSLAYQLFDAAIHHGRYRAAKWLQMAVGAKPDGIIGRNTLAAIAAADPYEAGVLFLQYRTQFITGLTRFKTFGRGWTRRIALNMGYLLRDIREPQSEVETS